MVETSRLSPELSGQIFMVSLLRTSQALCQVTGTPRASRTPDLEKFLQPSGEMIESEH